MKGVQVSDAERELGEAVETPAYSAAQVPHQPRNTGDTLAQARSILGVPPGSSLNDIGAAYVRIVKLSNPSRFPSGSPEAQEAGQIMSRVRWAFSRLTEGMDPTIVRFYMLEID